MTSASARSTVGKGANHVDTRNPGPLHLKPTTVRSSNRIVAVDGPPALCGHTANDLHGTPSSLSSLVSPALPRAVAGLRRLGPRFDSGMPQAGCGLAPSARQHKPYRIELRLITSHAVQLLQDLGNPQIHFCNTSTNNHSGQDPVQKERGFVRHHRQVLQPRLP